MCERLDEDIPSDQYKHGGIRHIPRRAQYHHVVRLDPERSCWSSARASHLILEVFSLYASFVSSLYEPADT